MRRVSLLALNMIKIVILALLIPALTVRMASAAVRSGGMVDMVDTREAYAKNGMVSSAHLLASEAGVEILQKGGNAVDAAVATALALNVVEFNSSGVGGGGFAIIRLAKTGEVICLDYRETAPASSTKDMFSPGQLKKGRQSSEGGGSVAVPAFIAGMCHALENYGTMSFAEVAVPAIRLAHDGFTLHEKQSDIISKYSSRLQEYNAPDQIPYLKGDVALSGGERLRQPKLANLFSLIAEKGQRAFYEGPVAEAIIEAVNRTGGNMTPEDLNGYAVQVREPVTGYYRGCKIYSVPPPSSGGAHLIQLLNIMELFPVRENGRNSVISIRTFAEASKIVFADREAYMADTAFAQVPLEGLVSKAYAQNLAARIDPNKIALEVPAGDPWKFQKEKKVTDIRGLGPEQISTTSFSVMDAEGNVVASTNTINTMFGSCVIVPEYGILLNNEMADFSRNPESVNAPEPGKRPLSSMSPTIVLDREGRPYISVGAAGGTKIFTSVAQVIMNIIDYGMTMGAAVLAPRIHNELDDGRAGNLMIERDMPRELIKGMRDLHGYTIEENVHVGTVQGILKDNATGTLNGGADSRRLGVPVGY